MTLPEPTLRHLQRMTDDTSLFEHAIGSLPHRALGYCTDDAGRGLAVAVRSTRTGRRGARGTMARVPRAGARGRGRVSSADGVRPAMDGRPVVRRCQWPSDLRHRCRRRDVAPVGPRSSRGAPSLRTGAPFRSNYPRATAHAVVGAAELTVADARCVSARSLVEDGLASLPRGTDDTRWPWPEPRLAYGNALLPEALIAAGHAMGDDDAVDEGLRMLRWLVAEETLGGSLQLHAGRRPRPRRRASGVRSATDRGGCARRCLRSRVRRHARRLLAGERSARAPDGSTGRTTWGSPMFDPETGGASTGWSRTGSTRTRAPNRRSRSSPRCSTRGCWSVGSVQRAAWSAASS